MGIAPPANPFLDALTALRDGVGGVLSHLRLPGAPPPKAAPPTTHRVGTAPRPTTPLTRETLGRATWTLLHAVAASYPDKPSRDQKKAAAELVGALAKLYPCAECADHLRGHLAARPLDASSGPALRAWACALHNDVNADLGKPVASCAPAALAAAWPALECEVDGRAACALKR